MEVGQEQFILYGLKSLEIHQTKDKITVYNKALITTKKDWKSRKKTIKKENLTHNKRYFDELKGFAQLRLSFQDIMFTASGLRVSGFSSHHQWGYVNDSLLKQLQHYGYIGALKTVSKTDKGLFWKGEFTREKS